MPRRQSAKSDPDPRWTSKLPPAPGDLRIVQAFVNTADLRGKTDLAGPEALAAWLAHWSLAPPETALDDDFERAIGVREALRAIIATNCGAKVSPEAVAHLDEAAAPATLRVRFEAGGRARFQAVANQLDGALARLCSIVAAAQLDGSWRWLKICANQTCRAAFFDFSRNHSAKFCQVQCGNRISALAYRNRNIEYIRNVDRVAAWGRRWSRSGRKLYGDW